LFDDRCAALCVAADDDDLHAVTGEAQGDFFAEAGGRAGDESGEETILFPCQGGDQEALVVSQPASRPGQPDVEWPLREESET
jgi:hypothetical protein